MRKASRSINKALLVPKSSKRRFLQVAVAPAFVVVSVLRLLEPLACEDFSVSMPSLPSLSF